MSLKDKKVVTFEKGRGKFILYQEHHVREAVRDFKDERLKIRTRFLKIIDYYDKNPDTKSFASYMLSECLRECDVFEDRIFGFKDSKEEQQ